MVDETRVWSRRWVVLGLLGVGLTACGGSASQPPAASTITPAELANRLAAETAPLILDVRSQREYEQGHIPGARHIPHHELAQRLGELPRDPQQEIVVYCEVGVRAHRAEQILTAAGFRGVRHLTGDMRAWRQGQYPTALPSSPLSPPP
ncbi:MAG: rhodanese-like domain-containing protein [Leptolyngbya sp.]|nr:rhodanese-like domain-containing protein [Leptolyngbya sp.]